jgi:SAM-dependent methyltransferase
MPLFLAGVLLMACVVLAHGQGPCETPSIQEVIDNYHNLSSIYYQKHKRHPGWVKKALGARPLERNHLVSVTGGWNIDENTSYHLDEKLSLGLLSFIGQDSFLNIGAGKGHYEKFLKENGYHGHHYSLDAAPNVEQLTNGAVHYGDASTPFHLPKFDWVISIEVAEHVPPQYEDQLMLNFVNHARKGVIISWATPGQNGIGHFNEKTKADVKKLFQAHSFHFCDDLTEVLSRNVYLGYIRRNLLVFFHDICECPKKK